MFTFDSLVFREHPTVPEGTLATVQLGECHVSVITGATAYQGEGQYEVLITSPDGSESLIGWQTPQEVDALLTGLQLGQIGRVERTEPELEPTSDHDDARAHFEHVHQTHFDNDEQDLY